MSVSSENNNLCIRCLGKKTAIIVRKTKFLYLWTGKTFEQSVLIPRRTLEGRYCLLSSYQFLLSQRERLARGVRSCVQLPEILGGAGGRGGGGETARQEDRSRSMRPRYRTAIELLGSRVCLVLDFFPPLSFFARTDPPALQTKKMPKSSPRVFPWPSLWLASLLILMVQSVLSSSSTYQRPAVAGKRQGFLERTLVLLDVNTRSSIRVLNENFLSLQLDPSIIRDGWLDFLRYKRTLSCLSSTSIYMGALL